MFDKDQYIAFISFLRVLAIGGLSTDLYPLIYPSTHFLNLFILFRVTELLS